MADTPVAPAAREFGVLLRERRDALGRTAADLARATSVPRTYIHDCEAGRKWPNRAWVERYAALPPADPPLLERYDVLAAKRRPPGGSRRAHGQAAIELVLDLQAQGAAPDDRLPSRQAPAEFRAYQGRVECLEAALDLLAAAGSRPPQALTGADERFSGILTLDSPSLERSDLPWVPAVREALQNRWTVVHLLAPEDDPERRVQRVRSLLSLLSLPGAYHPVVHPGPVQASMAAPLQTMETVVAPGYGVLQQYPAAGSACYFPWSGTFRSACHQMALASLAVQAAADPLLTVYEAASPALVADSHTLDLDDPGARRRFAEELRQLPPKVAYDTAVTEAVVRGGRRALLKAGLVLACMPPHATQELSLRLKRRAERVDMPEYIPLIEILTTNRRQRRQALHEFPSRDICTVGALQAYLDPEPADPWAQQHDPLSSRLTLTDRIAHVRGVMDLLQRSDRYEVGLAESPEMLPVPVGPSYWMATDSALFFVGPRPHGAGTRYVIVRDSAVVQAFFELFDRCWDALGADMRARAAVIATLQQMVDKAERSHSDTPVS